MLGGVEVSSLWSDAVGAVASALAWLGATYASYRELLVSLSDAVAEINDNPLTKVSAVLAFAALTLPAKAADAKAFFDHAMAPHPIPLYKRAGIGHSHIILARRLLLFYVLFLAYQIIQFPLTFGQTARHVFYFDLVIQVGLLTLMYSSYAGLRNTVKQRWDGDNEQQDVVAQWLDKKLNGLNVKPGRLRSLALAVFAGSFVPALLVSLPTWLDLLATWNTNVVELLRGF